MPRFITTVFLLICMILAFETLMISGEFYYEDGNDDRSMSIEDDNAPLRSPADKDKRSSSIYVHRRSCIRRGGACDHRPNDCCFSSSCRCNLWGSNCRCQRMGLFQKWG